MEREPECSTSCSRVLAETLESILSLLWECWSAMRDPLCYSHPRAKAHRSTETAAERLLTPGSVSAVGSAADLDTEHHAEVLQQGEPGPSSGVEGICEAEREHSFHTAVSLMRKESPFYKLQAPATAPSVELKEATPNLLLGQYHMEPRQRQFVQPHPGSAVRRAPPSPEPRLVTT